uniref:Uncharacterized protein n=1 Tax=Rhodnius prolixus TaxID=13249 RepID=T1H992_RHOPR
MRYYLPVLLIAFCIAATKALDENVKDKILGTFRKCRNQHPISDKVQQIKNFESVPSSREAKCLAACMLKEAGMLRDGKYNKEVAKFVAEGVHEDQQEVVKSKEMIDHCTAKVGEFAGDDECEFAYRMAICSHDYAKK